jgi:hypothetical protein
VTNQIAEQREFTAWWEKNVTVRGTDRAKNADRRS